MSRTTRWPTDLVLQVLTGNDVQPAEVPLMSPGAGPFTYLCAHGHDPTVLRELLRAATEMGRQAGIQEGKALGIEEGRRSGYEEGKMTALSRYRNTDHGRALEEEYDDGYRRGHIVGFAEGADDERERLQDEKPMTSDAAVQAGQGRMCTRAELMRLFEEHTLLDLGLTSYAAMDTCGPNPGPERAQADGRSARALAPVVTSSPSPIPIPPSSTTTSCSGPAPTLPLPTLPPRDLSALRSDCRPTFQLPFNSLKRRAHRRFQSRRVLPTSLHPHLVAPLDWSGDKRLQDLSRALTALGWTRPP